jgi:hypothetical protein
MGNMRNELSMQEKIAREISKVDSDAVFVNMNDKSLDEHIDAMKREKWNESVQKIEDKFANHEKKLQEAADEYAKNLNEVQIMPIGNYVIVRPFTENPFQKVTVSSSGLITDLGGMIPEYKNSDSGEYEEAEQVIKVGVVIEAGPECKWLKSGDTIMWTVMSEVVIPFYNFGFRLVNETRAICVINDDLNERFKKD